MSRYENPNLLQAMADNPFWPIAVTYPGNGKAIVECGRWGRNGGWIRYEESYQESEMPEHAVRAKYRLAVALEASHEPE